MTTQIEMNFENTTTICQVAGRWPIPQAQWPRMALRDFNNPDTVRQEIIDKVTPFTYRTNENHPTHGQFFAVWYGHNHTVEKVRAFFTRENAIVFADSMARAFEHVTITTDRY